MEVHLSGCSRIVVLIGPYAFKIARVRPLYWTYRLFFWATKGKINERLHTHHQSRWYGALKYITKGIRANLTEYKTWKRFRDPNIFAPTLLCLFGVINIQRRGRPLDIHEYLSVFYTSRSIFTEIVRAYPDERDLRKREHFCLIDGKPCLVDYGEPISEYHFSRFSRQLTFT
ncbi:MAG: hypothetical protein WDZ88_00490 [Candidatus Paceibacterota bacterium]